MAPSGNRGLYTQIAARAAERVPGLRMLPVVRLVMAGEVLLLGKHHLDRLTPTERSRLVQLVSKGRGRPRNLNAADRAELSRIVDKLEPRILLAEAADRLSPVGVPGTVRDKLAGTQHRRPTP